MDEPMWIFLPDTALIEIYSCLRDRSRVNMAMTCKNWNRVFSSPCLWRTRYIELGGYRAKAAGDRACNFADMHGTHLRYLFLSCAHPCSETCKIMQMNIEDFLEKIQDSNLIRFELERLNLDRFWKFDNLKGRVVNCFTRFFRGQKSLESFDMGDAHFSLTNGCRVLEAIGKGSGSSVRVLGMIDLFNSKLAIFQMKRFREAFSMFNNLSHLALKYSCLSDTILECMTKRLAGKLKSISIMVNRIDPYFHRISSSSWRNLKSVCPELSVSVWFESIALSSDINRILVPEAPVREIRIWTGYDDHADWGLSETINHIALHHKQIVVLSMELDNVHESIADSLVAMMISCKALRELHINAVLTVVAIDRICTLQSQRKNLIDLQTFHVTTSGLTEFECLELRIIIEKHLPIMQQRGLDFKIVSDFYTDCISSMF